MTRILTLTIAAGLTFGSIIARANGDAKAAALLDQARAAIGGDKVIADVHGLSFAGTVQRALGDRQITGELTIDLQLPDKMLRTESISPMGDSASIVTETGVNGDTMIRRTRTINAPPGMMIRTPPPPPPGSDAEAQALRNSRAEMARFVAAMLLTPTAVQPVEFTYNGEAESPDGKADVVDVKGAGGFAAKLFFDQQTHRLLMLTYRGASPRMVVQTQRHEGPPAAAEAKAAAPPTPEIVDISMFVDDYQPVAGVLLPHHVTRSVDGQPSEEWTFKTIKVNPPFKPDTFAVR